MEEYNNTNKTQSASEALAQMRASQQRQSSTGDQVNRPKITPRKAPKKKDDDGGCMLVILLVAAFLFGFFVLSML